MALLLNLPEIAAGSLLVLMSITVVLQVVFRYVIQAPISWSEELSTFSFIWLATLSAALGVKYESHFSLEVVVKRFPLVVRRLLQLLGALATSGLLGVLIWFGINLVAMNTTQISPAMGMPMSVPYLSVPVSCTLMLLYLLGHVIRSMRGEEQPVLDTDSRSGSAS